MSNAILSEVGSTSIQEFFTRPLWKSILYANKQPKSVKQAILNQIKRGVAS